MQLKHIQQGVALAGRNTTGPPPGEYGIPWSVTDDDRRQRASLVWLPYTMSRRASNKTN